LTIPIDSDVGGEILYEKLFFRSNSFLSNLANNNDPATVQAHMRHLCSLIFILLFPACLFGQKPNISLEIRNGTYKEILSEIEIQSEYRFVYRDEVIEDLGIRSVKITESDINQVLDVLFSNKDIRYHYLDDQLIVITYSSANRIISGTVTSRIDGQPLEHVNVSVKGRTIGTVTNEQGRYRLTVPNDSLLLVFSYIGYLTEELLITEQSIIDVELKDDILGLEEVVVMGYGSAKKRIIIGSQVTISENEMKDYPSQSFINSLQGIAAGVNVSAVSGTPGAPVSVKIRGVNSINAGTDPLWIVDGMPVFNGTLGRSNLTVPQDIMSTINPNDIASVEILKDAAATAIYGSRGSNGVIIVTTKSGTSGINAESFSFSYSTGISTLTQSPESFGFANTSEWWEIMDRAAAADDNQPWNIDFTMKNPNFETSITKEHALQINTDWFDYLLQRGFFSEANLSHTRSFERGSIFTSVNYTRDHSVNKGNELTRFSGRINTDFRPVKNLDIDTRLNLMATNNFRTKTKGGNTGTGYGFGAASVNALPWYPVADETNSTGYWNPKASVAPTINRDLLLDNVNTYRALGGIYAEYKFPWFEGLSVRTEGLTDIIQSNSIDWFSGDIVTSGRTTVYEGSRSYYAFNYNAYLKYVNSFKKKHFLNFTIGTESYRRNFYLREMEALDPVSYNQEIGSTNPAIMSSMKAYLDGERYIRSYFGRAKYSFKDRYIFGLSFRRDGSSAFNKENRWGNFAAISAGWIISDEDFFRRFLPTVNLFKIRGSFGQTGNESIPNNQNITRIFNSANLRYVSQEILPAGTGVSVGNSAITWEVTNSLDVGIDFGFLHNRISGSAAYYYQHVSDLLLQVSTPPSAAVGAIYDNVGDLNNRGWEIDLNTINISRSKLHWVSSINLTTNNNRIISLTPEMERQKGSKLYVGGQLGTHKLARYAGIDPERGVRMIWEIDRDLFNETGVFAETGRKIPATHNNLGQHAQIFEGKTNIPKYYGGFYNEFRYNNLELSIHFTFTGGHYIYNYKRYQWVSPTNGQYVLLKDLLTHSWTTAGQRDAKYPLLYTEGHAPASTKWDYNATDPNTGLTGYWKYPDPSDATDAADTETYERQDTNPISTFLEKGDYLRLRSVKLAYNFDERFSKKIFLSNLGVFIRGTNLLTWTAFSGFDPETVQDWDYLPALRTYSIGIQLSF